MLRGLLCYTLFSEFLRELSTTYSFLTEKSVPQNFSFCDTPMERARRIELPYAAWEAAVLPLNYARIW